MKINTKHLVLTAFFIALGLALPPIFHVFGTAAGRVLLPMHIPVLLCGFICGWRYGLLCGLVVPFLSSALTGMPPLFPVAVAMSLELGTYGVISGLLYQKVNIYGALILAMVGGRIVSGLANMALLGFAGKAYGWQVFIAGNFISAMPGIILQLILVPVLVVALAKVGLIEQGKALQGS